MRDRFTIAVSATDENMDVLRRRYRLFNKSDDEVATFMFDQMFRDPTFHRTALPKKRTDSDKGK